MPVASRLRSLDPVTAILQRLGLDLRPHSGDAFTQAYATTLSNRLPLLYCIVLFDIAILAASFAGEAPTFMTQGFPILLASVIGARASHWLPRHVRLRPIDELARDLYRLSYLGSASAFACTLWALALYNYGDRDLQSLVHYVVAVTCFTGILGLGQSPLTALRMALVTIVPSTLWFLVHAHPNALAVCAVQIVVSALLLVITYKYHADFVALETSRQVIAAREREANLLATRDTLTGVPNRRAILARLERCLADPSAPSPWLAMVDLDGFKHVNDTFGHAAGDAVLLAVCEKIAAIDEILAFGRLGGDEFAVLLPGEMESPAVHAVLSQLIESIARRVPYEGYQLSVGASIGLRRTERKAVHECLERADEALYKAKQIPGRIVEFEAADEAVMADRQAITRLFCTADLGEQIGIVYQPIVDFDTRAVSGYEALARWTPDPATCVMPTTFVALAESTGRTGELTATVLERALQEFIASGAGAHLSVNLSAQDILRDGAADWIAGIVEKTGAKPRLLTLEITETAVMLDMRRAAAALEALRARGFRIALDDFGTGQSSLSRVHQLPLDQIKIDRSFACDIDTNPAGRAVAATILSLARQLGLECTIEGIETLEQANCARLLGLRSMQGYLFGRPAAIGETGNVRAA